MRELRGLEAAGRGHSTAERVLTQWAQIIAAGGSGGRRQAAAAAVTAGGVGGALYALLIRS